MEGSHRKCRGAVSGGGERALVEESDGWRGAIAGGVELSLVKGSDLRWRGAVSGESQAEGSDRRWRGMVSGGPLHMLEGLQKFMIILL